MCEGRKIPNPCKKEYNAKFYLVNGETITSTKSIDSLKNELKTFYDVGDNYFINMDNIKEICVEKEYIVMESGKKLTNKIFRLKK